jgi:hypothetical protein
MAPYKAHQGPFGSLVPLVGWKGGTTRITANHAAPTGYVDTALSLGAFMVHSQTVDGSTWYDESANGLNGARTVSPTWNATGGPGSDIPGYFSFNGSSQYIDVGNPALLQFNGVDPFSFVYWVRRDNNTQAAYTQIIGKGNAPGYQVFRTGATTDASQVNFDIQYTAWVQSDTGYFTGSSWQMFMSRFTGTEIQLWKIVNGTATHGYTTVVSGTFNGAGNSLFQYGAQDRTHTAEARRRFFRGDIAGVSAYNTALSQAQFQSLYDATGVP